MIGTPRNDLIDAAEPNARRMPAQVRGANRLAFADDQTKQPVAAREIPDPLPLGLGHP
jgi:hypothetical protein